MRRTMILAAGVLAAAVLTAAPANPPFTMNGWQFHEYDMPKLTKAIQAAPQYGVNFFIFSHGLFRSVDAFQQSPEWQRDINQLGAQADKQGIKWYLWVHEFDDIPARFRVPARETDRLFNEATKLTGSGSSTLDPARGRVNMDDPALVDYLRKRYDTLLDQAPTAAGLVLTIHESENKPFRDTEVQSKLPIPERIYLVAKLIYDIVHEHHKQLIVRNFFYEPKEMDFFKDAISRLPDDVLIMSKDTTHEFHPFYPYDPLHGKMGNKKQIMEADLGVEKAWGSQSIYAQPDYIRRDVLRARETGLAGIVGRAHFFEPNFHEINLYAMSRFMKDPDLGVDAVLRDWTAQRYPAEAVPYVASALKRTEFIHHHGRWFLGFWLTQSIGGQWGDYPYYFGHALMRSNYKWTQAPADKAVEQGLYHPDKAFFDRLVAEKDDVLKEVRAGQGDLRRAARYLPPEQQRPLDEAYGWLLDAAQLQREWTRAYFGMRMWMDRPTDDNAALVHDALGRLEEMDRAGHRYNIDKFVLEMRWRMANRVRALQEDDHIIDEVKRLAEVERN